MYLTKREQFAIDLRKWKREELLKKRRRDGNNGLQFYKSQAVRAGRLTLKAHTHIVPCSTKSRHMPPSQQLPLSSPMLDFRGKLCIQNR